ncbi:MAG: DegQ family serine endoprotease [Nitrospira sp.]|nr:DegQ family serine endoprotease [Nitrospira sp.]
MANPLVNSRPRLMREAWVAVALAVVFGAFLSVQSCLPEPKLMAPSWAEEASLPSASLIPSSQTVVAVAKQAKASVVNVSSTTNVGERPGLSEAPSPFFDDPFFRRFFGEELQRRFRQPRDFPQEGMGSGVIVSADGYIVTNNHVVEHADEIEVSLSDKRTFKAKVIGTDPKTDVAVIKIEATGLPILPWMDSGRLEVGELVLAVGSPFGLTQTVTMGIISAVGRANMGIVDYEDFIQTDAAINPGNSGGALVNLHGELVGINTAIFTRTGGHMGIGFAIPSNMVRTVMDSLIKHGKVVRGWLGVSIQALTPDLANEFGVSDTAGALVADVMADSPASKAGLERGDIITELDGKPVRDPTHLRTLVADSAPGTKVTITLLRDKRRKSLDVTLGELPKDESAQAKSEDAKGKHALAGVQVGPLSREEARELRIKGGVVVRRIDPSSLAAQAGLQEGDVVREVNRQAVTSIEEFEQQVGKLKAKDRVLLLVTRGRATIYLAITPG